LQHFCRDAASREGSSATAADTYSYNYVDKISAGNRHCSTQMMSFLSHCLFTVTEIQQTECMQ